VSAPAISSYRQGWIVGIRLTYHVTILFLATLLSVSTFSSPADPSLQFVPFRVIHLILGLNSYILLSGIDARSLTPNPFRMRVIFLLRPVYRRSGFHGFFLLPPQFVVFPFPDLLLTHRTFLCFVCRNDKDIPVPRPVCEVTLFFSLISSPNSIGPRRNL